MSRVAKLCLLLLLGCHVAQGEIKISTRRLELKPIPLSGIPEALQIMFLPEIRERYFSPNHDLTWQELRSTQKHRLVNATTEFNADFVLDYHFGIYFEGKLIGAIFAEVKDEFWPPLDTLNLEVRRGLDNWYALSFFIAPQFQARGFASEALRGVVAFLSRHPEHAITGFYALTLDDNLASQKVLTQCEFSAVEAPDQYRHFALRIQ